MKEFSKSILPFHSGVIVLICCIAYSSAWGFERKRKLLVLHSYHQGLQWTDNVSEGIQSVFKQLQGSYEVHFEYLDAKRSSASRYQKRLLEYIEEPNHFHYFDVIIVSDNMGLEFVASNYPALFEDIPIVFCGINGYRPQMVDFTPKITGVIETTDYRATIKLMLELHPEKKKILVILDRTPTGNLIAQEIKRVEKQFDHISFEYYRDFVLQNVPTKLQSLDDDYLIYQLTFNRDKNGAFISYSEGIEVVSRYSQVPVYGSWDFYLGKGIVGGVITSGYCQGQTAAALALRILQGEPVESISIIDNAPTKVMFDHTYLTHYGVSPSRLPKDSVIRESRINGLFPSVFNYAINMEIRVNSTFKFSCFWGCSEQLNRPETHFPAMLQAMCPADPYCTQGFSSQSSPSPLPGRLFLQANFLPSGFAHRKHAQPLHEPSIWSCYSSVPELSAFGSEC
ncbi:hypothetical protein JWH17_01810, partial [Desulfobulbus marinus]|nr:hypothetical protein [Desulfogranum marinum]